MGNIFAGGTVDQKKEFVAIYVKTLEADPNAKSVKISLFPALFSQIIAGGDYDRAKLPPAIITFSYSRA